MCLFREGCKSTAKLNKSAKTVAVMCTHNHDCTERFKLRAKCKTAAKKSMTSLRQLFDETTRYQTSANDRSFKSCESIMYRSRRETQPRIPKSALEFSTIIEVCPNFGQFYKGTVVVGENCSVIFYSNNILEYLDAETNIYLMERSKSARNNS